MTKEEEFEYLIERSRRFYDTSIFQLDKGFYDLAAFSLEQALQLYLEASLLKLGVDYPRTHNIRRLLELIYELTNNYNVKDLLLKFSVELPY